MKEIVSVQQMVLLLEAKLTTRKNRPKLSGPKACLCTPITQVVLIRLLKQYDTLQYCLYKTM